MSLSEAVEVLRHGFALRDQVSLSELRSARWREHLARVRKLRVMDRNEPVAVLVSPELWEALEGLAEHLERLEEKLEESELEALWGHRLGHQRRPAREEAQRLRQMLRSR